MTPNIAIVRIDAPHWPRIPLWIPLFLLWIPAILLSPIVLVVIFGLAIAGELDPFHVIRTFWDLLCSLPGTDVRVTVEGKQILVRIL